MKILLRIALLGFIVLLQSCNKDDLNTSLIENIGLPARYTNAIQDQLDVALVSFTASNIKSDNIAKMSSMIDQITLAHPETRLITFGETVLGLYYSASKTTDYNKTIAETIPGAATNLFSTIAQSKNCYIAFGLYEKDGEKIYNSLVLIDPNGNLIAKHRKVHLTDYDRSVGTAAGAKDTISITNIDGIKTCLAICADGQDYWLTQQIAKAKPKLVIHSIADETNEMVLGNGMQYNAWVVSSNRTGSELDQTGYNVLFSGYHCISDPVGRFVNYSEGNERYSVSKINFYN